MKRIPFLDASISRDTQAAVIYNNPHIDATRKFMRLMDHTRESLATGTTAERDPSGKVIGYFDFKQELKQNIEFHAGLDFARALLKNTQADGVDPDKPIRSMDRTVCRTPMQHADKIGERFPELGEFFKAKLNARQKTLHVTNLFRQNRQKTVISGPRANWRKHLAL